MTQFKMVCKLCGCQAKWSEDELVWRHKVDTEQELFDSSFCDKYGYPIDVKESQ